MAPAGWAAERRRERTLLFAVRAWRAHAAEARRQAKREGLLLAAKMTGEFLAGQVLFLQELGFRQARN